MNHLTIMDTLIRTLIPLLAIIQIMLIIIIIFCTKEKMKAEGEAEDEGGEKGTEEVQAPGGKELEVILSHMVAATDIRVASILLHIPWLVLMDPTGDEKVEAGIWNKLMKTKMPRLKNLGSLVRSRERENRMTI